MKKAAILILFLLFCFSVTHAQQTDTDSAKSKNVTVGTDAESELSGMSGLHIEAHGSGGLFFLQHDPFIFSTNLNPDTNLKNISSNSLYFSQPFSLNSFNDSKSRMFGSLYNIYSQNKPGKMQQILGMVQFSGAAILAGYHIYKYYIKEKK